ncbi:MAG: hypothetical protein DRH26_00480 [Deltaproteobacteria bacterium]|nr:MAG: hypothetical protein DRH26_00480 [Deltaproteobacteria bacterium]
MRHTAGAAYTQLNTKKGIWCECCGKDCTAEHLITFGGDYKRALFKELICTKCAIDLITCLRKSLTEALLTDKEIK